jgi:predicted ferric reductase
MSWLWFANRGTGVVLVALMTLATALGVMSTARTSSPRWPRFATQGLHRNVSLLAVATLLVHAVTAIADEYVDLRWYHVFAPVGGPYAAKERLPLALSALAFDLLLIVLVTSLLRDRLPHRLWRGLHLLTYLAWALGVVHGLLIGTDLLHGKDTTAWWAMGVTLISVGVVAVAGIARLVTFTHERRREAQAGSLVSLP